MIGVGPSGPLGPAPAGACGLSEPDAWAVLASIEVLGPVAVGALLRRYGSARATLEAAAQPDGLDDLALTPGDDPDARPPVSAAVAGRIAHGAARAPELLEAIRRAGLRIVTLEDPAYPVRLLAIEMPPHVLFVRGDIAELAGDPQIAVVGTRHPTEAGRFVASRIGATLGRAGAVVVSGLAVGIDGAAHEAALSVGAPTVAVIGSGHEHLYPRAHDDLAARIVDRGGAVVSELPPHVRPSRWTFPRRNRLIAGLADATVVVEAPNRSGALITAGWALEQGRDCYVVPGAIDDPAFAGSLELLRSNVGQARPVASVAGLLEDLGLVVPDETLPKPARRRRKADSRLPGPSPAAVLAELGSTEASVARLLIGGRSTVDELAFALGLPVATILGTLTVLEMRGLARSAYGRYRPSGPLLAAA